MSILLLKPVKFTERKPLRKQRLFVVLYNGARRSKTWNPGSDNFALLDKALVDVWYDEMKMPSAEDMQAMVGEIIPAHASYEERQAMLRGVRLCMERLQQYVRDC